MVDELREALDLLGQLPDIEQREWDEMVSSPQSKSFLKRLIAEAKAGESVA